MTAVIAASYDDLSDRRTTHTARAIAALMNAEVRQIDLGTVHKDADAALTQRMLSALSQSEVVLGVLPVLDERHRVQSWPILQYASKPLILVPASNEPAPQTITRTLIPLDGTPESAAAVAETVHLLARSGVELIVLHVFDATTVPKFWDQSVHAEHVWQEEFLARYCNEPGVRMQLRSGTVADHVLDVATAERVDMIALGWSQHLDPGRARTLRRTLRQSAVPVLVVPVRDASRDVRL